VNDADAVHAIDASARAELGEHAVFPTDQSLGGEDFSWLLEKVPGAMVRLGTKTPGGRVFDLHQPDLIVDERAIGVGARVLTAAALWEFASRPA
jgi:amidohydrolase